MRPFHLPGEYEIKSGLRGCRLSFGHWPGGRYPDPSQAMQVLPFGPAPARQEKVPHSVFGSDQSAAFEKIPVFRGLKMKQLAPVVGLDNLAVTDVGHQACQFKFRFERTDRCATFSEYAAYIAG